MFIIQTKCYVGKVILTTRVHNIHELLMEDTTQSSKKEVSNFLPQTMVHYMIGFKGWQLTLQQSPGQLKVWMQLEIFTKI